MSEHAKALVDEIKRFVAPNQLLGRDHLMMLVDQLAALATKAPLAQAELAKRDVSGAPMPEASFLERQMVQALNGVKAWRDSDGNEGFPTDLRMTIEALLMTAEQRRTNLTATPKKQSPEPAACKADPGECAFNGACMYACDVPALKAADAFVQSLAPEYRAVVEQLGAACGMSNLNVLRAAIRLYQLDRAGKVDVRRERPRSLTNFDTSAAPPSAPAEPTLYADERLLKKTETSGVFVTVAYQQVGTFKMPLYLAPAEPLVTDEMVSRFLAWRLPNDFGPDCGVSFDGRRDDEWNKNKTWPIGTNLLTAEQAKAMLEHVLAKQGGAS